MFKSVRMENVQSPIIPVVGELSRGQPADNIVGTGCGYSEEALRQINRLGADSGIYHISDEAYEYFTYDDAKHFSPGAIADATGHLSIRSPRRTPDRTFGLENGGYLRISYGPLKPKTAADGIGRLVNGLKQIVRK